MRLRAPVLACTTLFSLACLCGGPGGEEVEPPPPQEPDAVGQAFLDDAAEAGWMLEAGGTFYELAPYLDAWRLPKPERVEEASLDLLDFLYIGSFDLHPGGQLMAAESDPYEVIDDPLSVSAHLVVWDLEMNTVYADPSLPHHEIQSPYRWTPDGSALVYVKEGSLYWLDWETKRTRTVLEDHRPAVRDGRIYTTPQFSPDGAQLVYQNADDEVVIYDLSSQAGRVIGQGSVPTWSPDGATIVWFDLSSRDQVMAYDVATEETEVLFETSFGLPLIWTPDSRYLVWSRRYANSIYGDLKVYRLEDGQVGEVHQKVATLRDGQVLTLPSSFRTQLRLQSSNDSANPNRRGP